MLASFELTVQELNLRRLNPECRSGGWRSWSPGSCPGSRSTAPRTNISSTCIRSRTGQHALTSENLSKLRHLQNNLATIVSESVLTLFQLSNGDVLFSRLSTACTKCLNLE